MKTLVNPYYYKKELKAARKNGESGWAVINDRLRYERHIAAVICRENCRILACSARRSTPAAEPGQSNALHHSGPQ